MRDRSLSVTSSNSPIPTTTTTASLTYHRINGDNLSDTSSVLSLGTIDRHQCTLGWLYILIMFAGGAYSIAMGESIDDLAEQCGADATDASISFVSQGLGAFCGAISSAFLYQRYFGLNIVFVSLMITSVLLVYLSFNSSLLLLYIIFFMIGYLDGVIETGMFIILRKVLSERAGLWLGFGQIGNAMGFTFGVVLESFIDSQYIIFGTVGSITCLLGFVLIFLVNDEKMLQIVKENISRGELSLTQLPHYYVEIIIAIVVMLLYGGETLVTSYLQPYVKNLDIESISTAKYQLVVMWGVAFVSRLIGIYDQAYLLTNKNILWHIDIFLVIGIASLIPIVVNLESSTALWYGLAFYGFAFGPLVGYVYDWLNRSTSVSETSTAIVVFGMNVGTSLVLYVTTEIWNLEDSAVIMFYATLFTVIVPMPLLHLSRYLSYVPEINSNAVSYQYVSLHMDDNMDEEVRF